MGDMFRGAFKGLVTGLITGLFLFAAGCGDAASTGSTRPEAENVTTTRAVSTAKSIDPDERLSLNPNPPQKPVRLVFIHHSVGEDWLDDSKGGLGKILRDNNYFVSDTNYGWGPPDVDSGSENIGDNTDIGNWYNWFAGPNSSMYLNALFAEKGQSTGTPYARLAPGIDPGGENEIVIFKSCFPNSGLGGSPNDSATVGANPLRGEGSGSEAFTVGNAKGIYSDLLASFAGRQDKLFIVITAPPLMESDTTLEQAANARAFNRWLVNDWLADYQYRNVAVFDFYDVLTSNGGEPNINDLGRASGNHHRYNVSDDTIEYTTSQGSNFSAYASGDSHPTAAGLEKAADEFVTLLNIEYHVWKGE